MHHLDKYLFRKLKSQFEYVIDFRDSFHGIQIRHRPSKGYDSRSSHPDHTVYDKLELDEGTRADTLIGL